MVSISFNCRQMIFFAEFGAYITQTCPCNMQRFLQAVKMVIKDEKKERYFFLIFAQNIDCGYTLEPLQ